MFQDLRETRSEGLQLLHDRGEEQDAAVSRTVEVLEDGDEVERLHCEDRG